MDWVSLRTSLLTALRQFPDALAAVRVVLHIVQLDQRPMGTRYEEVAEWTRQTLAFFARASLLPLAVDVREAGASVLELLRAREVPATGIRITPGERESCDRDGTFHVAKAVLNPMPASWRCSLRPKASLD